MIIGVAGPSCSGKTTVSRVISDYLNCPLIHMDQYNLPDAHRPIVNGYPSYEQPHQYDHMAALKDVTKVRSQNKFTVFEGFLLFTYPEVSSVCDLKLLIDAPYDILRQRRIGRSQKQDYDGVWVNGHSEGADAGFLAHGESEWAKWGEPQHNVDGVISIDGSLPQDEVIKRVLDIVKQHVAG